jgi:ACS family hexuronate transporter-like MFS transporter
LKIKGFRWYIIVLIALGTAINYLDRQGLPIAIGELRRNFTISDMDFGLINSLFLFAYGTMYAVGGRILDIFGTRKTYAIMVIWWSLANILHSVVSSVLGLGIVRFLLGTGEGGSFPGSAKAISEWFPAKERAFAFGIFNTGSSLGALVAPLLISSIIAGLSWRWAFIICGCFGLIWVIFWLQLYSIPSKSKFITSGEKDYLSDETGDLMVGRKTSIAWRSLFQYREVWGLLTIKFFSDAGWFFFIFWLPKYLYDVRGLDIKAVGTFAWIPYAFAGVGSFVGGWFSSYLLKKGHSLNFSRKLPLGISAALLPFSLLIANSSLTMAIVFFSLAMLGHQSWATIVQTLAADLFPSGIVGTVAGLMGCVGTYGAMLFSLIAGGIVQNFGFGIAFIVAGLLHPLSFISIFLIMKKFKPVTLNIHHLSLK